MFERFFNWIGVLLIEYLFGALYKVIHVYNLTKPVRYLLVALVIISYAAIEIFLVHEAIRYFRSGDTYLMWLCIVAAPLFAVLIFAGYFYQSRR